MSAREANYMLPKIGLLPVIAALFVVFTPPAWAQSAANTTVNLTANIRELNVGDRVELVLAVTHPEGYQVILPRLPTQWGDFEVLGQGAATVSADESGLKTTEQRIEVTLFAPGDFETSEASITVRRADGEIFEKTTPRMLFKVRPVLGEDDGELRDIKSQADLSVPPLWPWILGGALLVAAAGVGVYILAARRSGAGLGPASILDTRPAYQVALEDLDMIEGMDLPGQGDFKGHYSLVSECVRRYLEDGFKVPSLDHTTDEIRLGLLDSPIGADDSGNVVEMMLEANFVKFARFRPAVEDGREFTVRARDFVLETRPAPTPELPASPLVETA